MGRRSTEAWTCEDSQRIELGYLLKKKMLVKGQVRYCTFSWTNGFGRDLGNISVVCSGVDDDSYVRLIYTLTEFDGIKYPYDYKIKLTTIPSNLGAGEVFYFLCPFSGKRCRVLYRAYGSHKWKSRGAYGHRLYYDAQKCSKYEYANTRYWSLERLIEKMRKTKHFIPYYKGRLTKKAQRMEQLWLQLEKWDELRWAEFNLPLSVRKELHSYR